MKTPSIRPQPGFSFSPAILLALAFGLWLTPGCGKKTAAEAPVPAPVAQGVTAPVPGGQPSPTPSPAPIVVATDPNGGVDLRWLNHAYIGWIIQNRQRPKTFEEFAAKSGLPMPPAPAGKKFIIDKNGFIALVSQ
jgi:hypothetical protein